MPSFLVGAAYRAYAKELNLARDKNYLRKHFPPWMEIFADSMPAEIKKHDAPIIESERHKKERLLRSVDHPYLKIGWFLYDNVTSRSWFEAYILANIILIGLFTGLDLESNGNDPRVAVGMDVVSTITTASFTLEVFCKMIVEGFEPLNYFTDPKAGRYNCFDFAIGEFLVAFCFVPNITTLWF